jgi:hypothetical protein
MKNKTAKESDNLFRMLVAAGILAVLSYGLVV